VRAAASPASNSVNSRLGYRLLLAFSALLFSTGGAAFKAASLTGWQAASFRSLVAAVVLLAVIPGTRRGWHPRMIPIALAYAATLVLFALANRLTTSANAIFLQSTAPIYVLLIAPWLLKEPVRRHDIVYILCVGAGLGIFALGHDPAVATAPNPPLGNVLGLASGVTYAAMLAGLRWLGRGGQGDAALATVAAGNVAAFLIALPMALPVSHVSAADAAVILYLGAIQIGLAYWCLTKGISHVPAFEATTMLQVEPAMNPVWTWLIHGERPNAWAVAGGVVIVTATLVNTWLQSRPSANGVRH
jgi:drug/metabolite transporter, DME family